MKGDRTKVSQTLKSMGDSEAKTEEDDPYAQVKKIKHEMIIFNFGNAVFQDLGKQGHNNH